MSMDAVPLLVGPLVGVLTRGDMGGAMEDWVVALFAFTGIPSRSRDTPSTSPSRIKWCSFDRPFTVIYARGGKVRRMRSERTKYVWLYQLALPE